ncbi:hypothetical protein ACFQY4_43855 [Catellatospora bangladeshensis]|uniref:Ig-like domain-containing protein n=1 Tax=Catellatospora bangladeshensis TaxID=310355 RepID=A0A8J3JPG1_9ACTN|nr:hypothetical protein [Catellatospora bangladeshensis]GIF82443.1 hypothetical protein Cba03nite_37920 [Catellatospora bangladeshensis]
MRTKATLLTLAAAVALGLSAVSPAYAVEPPQQEETVDEFTVHVDLYDETGTTVVSSFGYYPTSTLEDQGAAIEEQDVESTCQRPIYVPGGGDFAAKAKGVIAVDGPGTECPQYGSAAGAYIKATTSGCKTVTVGFTRKTLYGATQFRFQQSAYWCWKNNAITGTPSVTAWVSNTDGIHYVRSITWDKYFYQYKSGISKSGYVSQANLAIETCVVTYGCVWMEYPNIKIVPHGNGTYSWSWYNGD